MAPSPRDQKWYSIAEQASTETDPEKLGKLVAQLCSALDERGEPSVSLKPSSSFSSSEATASSPMQPSPSA
jgi:hypothetical protein